MTMLTTIIDAWRQYVFHLENIAWQASDEARFIAKQRLQANQDYIDGKITCHPYLHADEWFRKYAKEYGL